MWKAVIPFADAQNLDQQPSVAWCLPGDMERILKCLGLIVGCMVLMVSSAQAVSVSKCPDPKASDLQYGIIPPHWELSPFSNRPQADDSTIFKQANILVPVDISIGVSCTYSNSVGIFTIWAQGNITASSESKALWHKASGGSVCTTSMEACTVDGIIN